ncbi:MAG TPA: hypothetical protein VKP58_00220 [Candidatus Acidoferrum sp.]|nr:hypothetical protein [Candidatus Acidoferrum sp.]
MPCTISSDTQESGGDCKEILFVVLDRGDAWDLSHATELTERQEIINRAKLFVNGVRIGFNL